MLIKLLSKGYDVLFVFTGAQTVLYRGEQAYHPLAGIPRNNVFAFLPSDVHAWAPALIDWGASVGEPGVTYTNCFPIQASSPDPVRYRAWFKKCNALRWGLPLWSLEELALG